MRYLLLLVLLCGCTSVSEDTMLVYSINQGNAKHKYRYTIQAKANERSNEYFYILSNQEFRVGDRVELTLSKEN